MTKLKTIIDRLGLIPHPEGGFYKETYRSEGQISSSNLTDYSGNRNFATCIYFLLTADNFSAWHKIKQDEIWHFYDGDPIRLHLLSPKGGYSQILIGRDFNHDQVPQFVVPGGHWFASEVMSPGSFSLVGCSVAPGFDFADFELAKRESLTTQFPQHQGIIRRLTR